MEYDYDANVNYTGCSFYVQAYLDDWQLFRGDIGWGDVCNPSNKVIFIYVTSGDDGCKNGLWESKERGAIASVRRILPSVPCTQDIINIYNHPIIRYSCLNTKNYFLRLPSTTASRCYLQELHDGTLGQNLMALDNSTSYENWNDLGYTLSNITSREIVHSVGDNAWINIADNVQNVNSGLCLDRSLVSAAVQQFSPDYNILLYKISTNDPNNLSGTALENKYAVYSAFESEFLNEMAKNGGNLEILKDLCSNQWNEYGGKNYSRTVVKKNS